MNQDNCHLTVTSSPDSQSYTSNIFWSFRKMHLWQNRLYREWGTCRILGKAEGEGARLATQRL